MEVQNVHFCEGAQIVDLVQLNNLFDREAFWAKGRSLAEIAIALDNSEPVITIWQEKRLIGHGRATSDGIYRAMIWDVVIDQEFRGTGLGKKLVHQILIHPKVCNVERIYLTTTHHQEFYSRIGFKKNDTTTMVLCKGRK